MVYFLQPRKISPFLDRQNQKTYPSRCVGEMTLCRRRTDHTCLHPCTRVLLPRVCVPSSSLIRNELTQALTWHCLYSARHVDHRRRRSRTSAAPARRIVLRRRPRHLDRDTGGGAGRQAATAASVCSNTKQRGLQCLCYQED
jgi:hypothetical protein